MSTYKIDLDDLTFSQSRRRLLAKALEREIIDEKGALVQNDPKTIHAYTVLLEHMDKQVISMKKLAQEADEGDKNRQSAAMLHQVLVNLEKSQSNPFEVSIDSSGSPIPDNTKIPHKTLIEGEDETCPDDMNWTTFSSEFENR